MMAPEHKPLLRYPTMELEEIFELPVRGLAAARSHLHLWAPNAFLVEGLEVMRRWGFTYKCNLVWYKVHNDGGSDGHGVGFHFRNMTELILFGVRGSMRTCTLKPGRRQVNLLATRKREHSRKPHEIYKVIEACSPGPYFELFARFPVVLGFSGATRTSRKTAFTTWPNATGTTNPNSACFSRTEATVPVDNHT